MKEKEFNLSEKKQFLHHAAYPDEDSYMTNEDYGEGDEAFYPEENVKEFIKRLKDFFHRELFCPQDITKEDIIRVSNEIDKLAGEELC